MAQIIERSPDRAKNAARVKGEREPCYVCGRAVSTEKNDFYWIEVGGGGHDALLPQEVDAGDPGYLGCHPVGADCLKKQPALRPYARKAAAAR